MVGQDMRLDSHQHYWDPARGDYGWMPKDDPILSRSYGPTELIGELEREDIDGTILVQAAPTTAETDYLIEIAEQNKTVKRVVGWVNFEDINELTTLKRFAEHTKFSGVRPMIQDIEDIDWMLRDEIGWAFHAITEMDLTFDLLGFPKHLPNALRLLKSHPTMRVVLDHMMKPEIVLAQKGEDAFSDWAKLMSSIANETGAYVKLSGLVTEASDNWTSSDLKPFTDHVLSEFGPERVMWGSDWPVCLLRTDYSGWLQTTEEELLRELSDAQRSQILGGTAAKFYRIT